MKDVVLGFLCVVLGFLFVDLWEDWVRKEIKNGGKHTATKVGGMNWIFLLQIVYFPYFKPFWLRNELLSGSLL